MWYLAVGRTNVSVLDRYIFTSSSPVCTNIFWQGWRRYVFLLNFLLLCTPSLSLHFSKMSLKGEALCSIKQVTVKPFEHGSVPNLVSSHRHFKKCKDRVPHDSLCKASSV